MKLTNASYDAVLNTTKYILPALGTLYFTIAQILSLPYGEQVIGIIVAFEAFLGVIIAMSKKNWNETKDGVITLDTSDPNKDLVSIVMESPIEKLKENQQVTLKVENQSVNQTDARG